MRWQIADGFLADEQGQRVDESQTTEFKETPNTRARQEAIETCVGFANRDGGKIFFGVANDRRVKGTDMSANSIENLADEIRDHTYPSLLPPIEEVLVGGKRLVMIDVAAYVPPVVGVYLYSDQPLSQDASVDARQLQALVRVGRTNQKEDFMRLRQPMASDPRLRVALPSYAETIFPNTFQCVVWAEEGSATAHHITFQLDPDVGTSSQGYPDLPLPFRPLNDREFYNRHTIKFAYQQQDLAQVKDIQVIASFLDDWGLEWESTRRLCISSNQLEDGGGFSRRIVRFPSKRS